MTTLDDKRIEAEARRLLREQITRSPWFQNGMTHVERRKRIEQEVEAWWHVKIEAAAQRLAERAGTAVPATRVKALP